MKYLALLLCLALSACTTATMVSSPNSKSAFGPTNESSRVGTVKYLNQGADFVIEARREDAYKQMHTACKGRYKIVNESPHASGGSATNIGSGVTMFSSSEYWFINFQCD